MSERKMESAHSRGAVTVDRKEFSVGGMGFGLRQEFLRALVTASVPPDMDWTAVDAALAAVIPQSGPMPRDFSNIAERLIHWTAELQRAGGQPVFDAGRFLGARTGTDELMLAFPTLNVEAASDALTIVVELMSGLIDGTLPASEVAAKAASRTKAFIRHYAALRIGGSNTQHFLKAAFDDRMPWYWLAANVLQVGMGSKGRWLDSSFTDATPAISMRIARSKIATAELLRKVGLPVPAHMLARSADDAVAVAAKLGYPVVVKPADRDGGLAVAAGLTDEAGVRQAFEDARKASENVMVEKHVNGRDFRLVVHDGRMIWALERVPGGVTGDGVASVAALIERLNRDPARAKRADAQLKPLVFDREAAELLAGYGMTLESVPADGQRICLRRAANVASGGTPEAVFEKVHPDNQRLAERAAAVLRLDLAGIDLLIPDISKSWLDTGAAICEVNSQPTIGYTTSKHLYSQILRSLVDGNGRIPIAVIAGAEAGSQAPALLVRILTAAGLRTAIASSQRASTGDRTLFESPGNAFNAARAALLDYETDALVVSVSEDSVLTTGLPFDRCTTVVLAGTRFTGRNAGKLSVAALMKLLLPVSLGGVVLDVRAEAWRPVLRSLQNARVVMSSAGADLAAVRGHAQAGGETVVVEESGGSWRLMVAGKPIDLGGPAQDAIVCAPEDVALAAAAALSMDYAPDTIRRGLAGVQVTVKGAAA